MTPIEFQARMQATERGIVSDVRLQGRSPQHHERAWSAMEAFAVGRPDPTYPEGIYLLLREAPHGDFFWSRAEGLREVLDALRGRLPERGAAELQGEVDRRTLADLEREARAAFPDQDWPRVEQLLDSDEVLRRPDVRRAVVRLSRGDVARLEQLARDARRDWRDVLLWAQMEGLA